MKTRLREILLKIHFVALTIAILNALVKNLTAFSLEGHAQLVVKTLTVISGLTLFFFYLKPFKRLSFYFSIYATFTFFLIIGLIFRGIFWGIVISIFLLPMIPDSKKIEENEIIIMVPFQGFMSPCCSYKIKERQFLIFEKDYGMLELKGEGTIDFESVNIESNEKEIVITYSTDFVKGEIMKKVIKR